MSAAGRWLQRNCSNTRRRERKRASGIFSETRTVRKKDLENRIWESDSHQEKNLMTKIFTSFVLVIASCTILYAQPPAIQWQHSYGGSYGDAAWSSAIDYDGYIIGGISSSNDFDVT